MIITTLDAAIDLRERLRGRPIAFDFETTGTDWTSDRIIGLGIADARDEWYIHVGEGGLDEDGLAAALESWFDNPYQILVAHNAKFDLHWLANLGVLPLKVPIDTMGLAITYNEALPRDLKTLTWLVLDRQPRRWDKTFPIWSLEEKAEYCCSDVRNTFDLFRWFSTRIPRSLHDFYQTQVYKLPLVGFLMERVGWQLDRDAVLTYQSELAKEIDELKAQICASAPGLENPNSTQQLVAALELLGAKWNKDEYTKRGRKSVAKSVLERFAESSSSPEVRALASAILDLRKKVKLLGYLSGDRGWLASSVNGRLHPTWKVFGTFTGRWACANPNLQNIPKARSENTVNMRDWLIAAPGHVLVVADLSQAELRVLAALSQDERLLNAYKQGQDVHKVTAAAIFDKRLDEVSKMERFIGKTVNFATIYGAGPSRVSKITGVSLDDARDLLERFYLVYKGVRRWIENTRCTALADGVVYTAFGRPRRPMLLKAKELLDVDIDDCSPGEERLERAALEEELHKVGLSSRILREMSVGEQEHAIKQLEERALRQAVNAVIQGTVADIINQGVFKLIRQRRRVIGQVHDELIVETPISEAEETAKAVQDALSVSVRGLPMVIDAKVTPRWGA